jgi:GT2 family glycosyltransferase
MRPPANSASSAEIVVIVVNYGTAELAVEAVDSVLERTHDGRVVEVHLVDNDSPGDDPDRLTAAHRERAWQGRVTLWLESENHGFGRANNLVLESLALRETPPEYVFLLNPDARLENEAIAVLASFLDNHPQAALAGSRASNPGSDTPVTAAFRFPSLPATFAEAISFGPISRLFRRWEVALPPDLPTCRVDWVSGAGVMVRRRVWDDLGRFDPYYFLYFEEVDLMRACALAGWERWYVAEARILHVEGASTQVRSARRDRIARPAYWYDSWQHYFLKNHGRAYALATALAWVTGVSMNAIIARLRGQVPAAPLHFFRHFWAMAFRPLLGLRQIPY